MTWIEHPDMPGQRVQVPDLAVPHYRAAGWRVAEAPPKQQKLPTSDEAKPEEPQSTPSAAESADEAESKTDTESPKPRRRTTKED